jgi:hypothetical protein
MASVYCKCGDRLNNVEAPNDVEWRVYSDREWDEITNCNTIDPVYIPFPNIEVWRCPKCERVYVFKNNQLIKYYVLHDINEYKSE